MKFHIIIHQKYQIKLAPVRSFKCVYSLWRLRISSENFYWPVFFLSVFDVMWKQHERPGVTKSQSFCTADVAANLNLKSHVSSVCPNHISISIINKLLVAVLPFLIMAMRRSIPYLIFFLWILWRIFMPHLGFYWQFAGPASAAIHCL